MGGIQLTSTASFLFQYLPPSPSTHTIQSSLSHFFFLNGSDTCSFIFKLVPGTSVTPIFTSASSMTFSYLRFSSLPGVAGTNITDSFFSFPPPLNHSVLLDLLFLACSTFFHSLGLYSGSVPLTPC